MPSAVLGFGTFAYVTRLIRSTMLEVMQQDYIRTARAKGLAERVVVTTYAAQRVDPGCDHPRPGAAALVTVSFIIETMFSFPGVAATCAGHQQPELFDDHGDHVH